MRQKQTLPQLPTTTPVLMKSGLISQPWVMALQKLYYGPPEAASSGDLVDIPTAYDAVTNPRGLTLNDAGYLYEATDYGRVFRWSGTAWEYAPGERVCGEIIAADTDPGDGWHICDGSTVTRTKPDATTESVTLPNLIARYVKGASAYTGITIAASNTGSPSSTVTVQSGTGASAASTIHTHTPGEPAHLDVPYYSKL